jgi:uncharacterized protein (DUF433 family)
MDIADLLARIAAEPGKMGGKPVIRGRRITPSMVLTMLANGASREAALEAYPVLDPADIDACLLYAARLSDRLDRIEPSGQARISAGRASQLWRGALCGTAWRDAAQCKAA